MLQPKTRFFLDIDLGQAADFTAMTLLERFDSISDRRIWTEDDPLIAIAKPAW